VKFTEKEKKVHLIFGFLKPNESVSMRKIAQLKVKMKVKKKMGEQKGPSRCTRRREFFFVYLSILKLKFK